MWHWTLPFNKVFGRDNDVTLLRCDVHFAIKVNSKLHPAASGKITEASQRASSFQLQGLQNILIDYPNMNWAFGEMCVFGEEGV
jgi:hypothetical protein